MFLAKSCLVDEITFTSAKLIPDCGLLFVDSSPYKTWTVFSVCRSLGGDSRNFSTNCCKLSCGASQTGCRSVELLSLYLTITKVCILQVGRSWSLVLIEGFVKVAVEFIVLGRSVKGTLRICTRFSLLSATSSYILQLCVWFPVVCLVKIWGIHRFLQARQFLSRTLLL